MSNRRSRDRPKRNRGSADIVSSVIAILLIIAVVGSFGTLFRFDSDEEPGIQEPEKPEEPQGPEDWQEPEEFIYSTDVTLGSGKYAAPYKTLTYTYEGDYTAAGYNLGFTPSGASAVGGNAETSNSWTSVIDINGNSVMEFGKDACLAENESCFAPSSIEGDKYIFETDIRWLGSIGGVNPEYDEDDPNWFFRIELFGDETTSSNYFIWDMFGMYKTGEDYFYLSNDHEIHDYAIKIKVGTWVNLRVEYSPLTETTADVDIYVNGELVASEHSFQNSDDKDSAYTNNTFGCIKIENRGAAFDSVIQLDNTFVSAITTKSDNSLINNIDPNGWVKL